MSKPIDKERADAHYSGMLAELTGPVDDRSVFERWAVSAPVPYNMTPSKWIANGVTTYKYERTQRTFEGFIAARALFAAPAPADLTKELIEAVEIMIIGACACAIPHQGERDTMKMALEMARATLAKVRSQA